MDLKNKKVFVTGGAGFIGSHVVDKLVELGSQVTVYDNFNTGKKEFLKQSEGKIELIEADILDFDKLKDSIKGHDFVFHFAAHADVRSGVKDTRIDLDQNVIGTWNVLEAMHLNNIKKIAFPSTSSVYGEPETIPTPENAPLMAISMYGASKLANEGYIEAYCEAFDFQSWIFRFTSFIGERYTHGVIFDFVKKLLENQNELEILGDGNQKKSYLHVKDGVDAMLIAIEKADKVVNIFNLGHDEYLDVNQIADIVTEELDLKDIKRSYTGGKSGWIGDAPFVHLTLDRIKKLGWKPSINIEQGARITAKYLLANKHLLKQD